MQPCALIPSFNNAGTIGQVVASVRALGMPVLVVNDGSTDGTADEARHAGAKVVDHPENRGKGEALLTGFRAAWQTGYSHAITLDGDGQHKASDLGAFVEASRTAPLALFVGTRSMDSPQVPRSSRVGRAISDFMLWVSAGTELRGERPDTQCGYRSYPLSTVLALSLKGRRYELEMEVLVRAAWRGVPVRCLPIDVFYPQPEDRISHFRGWADNRRIVAAYTKLSLMRLFWPLFRPRQALVPLAAGPEVQAGQVEAGVPAGGAGLAS